MIADHHSDFISCEDIANAIAEADAMDARVAHAWELVEDATQRAIELEKDADHLRKLADRIALQLGFRKVAP